VKGRGRVRRRVTCARQGEEIGPLGEGAVLEATVNPKLLHRCGVDPIVSLPNPQRSEGGSERGGGVLTERCGHSLGPQMTP
jgi:hypothetical protein